MHRVGGAREAAAREEATMAVAGDAPQIPHMTVTRHVIVRHGGDILDPRPGRAHDRFVGAARIEREPDVGTRRELDAAIDGDDGDRRREREPDAGQASARPDDGGSDQPGAGGRGVARSHAISFGRGRPWKQTIAASSGTPS